MRQASGLKRISQVPENKPVIRKLLIATLCMVFIPLTLFFTFWKGGLAGMALGDDSPYLLTFSAVVAVVAVNIILCVYVVVAFSEDVEKDEKPKKN
eukprot:g5144.t1